MNQSNGERVAVVGPSQGRTSHESDASFTQAMNEYLEALEAGQPADREALLRRYPEFADELVSCLDGIDFIHQVAPQLGEPTPQEERRDSSERKPPAAALGDYRIIREIGRGGMGVVYEAEQLSMRRRVALKVLPFAAVMDQRQIARFKTEAQAAGLLQHTNIVPVYGVGCERGVHYYAMQYIEGMTLAEIIEQMRESSEPATPQGAGDFPSHLSPLPLSPRGEGRGVGGEGSVGLQRSCTSQAQSVPPRASPAGRPSGLELTIDSGAMADPSDQAPEQPELPLASTDSHGCNHVETAPVAALSTQRSVSKREYFRTVARLGIQAAEALDHAHKNGILHRDVKPGNLMLDMTGNLWVTDFGLARLEGNAQMTISGDLVGTLRYMSPEQALAKRVIVDHRSDIYSLGVTLYELLTLRPAFEGCDRGELLRQIAFEEPRPLCRIDKAIPLEFGTIVFKAMAKNPVERYATAQDLADDLRRLLMHEPIKARPPSLFDRLAKWSRRHRAWVLAAASMLIVLMVGSLASTAMIWSEKLATENALTREREQRELARQKADEARRAAAEAEDQRQRAETGFNKAREAINRMLTRVADQYLPVNPELESFRRQILEDAVEFSSELIALNPEDPLAYLERGRVNQYLNRLPEALADFEKLIELDPENAEWHYNLGQFLNDGMQDSHRAIDPLRRAIELSPETSEYRAMLARTHRHGGELGQALTVLEELIRLDPSCAHGYMERGWVHQAAGNLERFLADAQRAVELEPLCGRCQESLAHAHLALGQSDEALAVLNRALEVPWLGGQYESRGGHYAARSWVYGIRGEVLKRRALAHFHQGHYVESLADLSLAIEHKPDDFSTVIWIPPSLVARCSDESFRVGILQLADRAIELTNGSAGAYYARGFLYGYNGEPERAIADFSKAFEMARQRSVSDNDLALLHNNIAWFFATCPDAKLRNPTRAVELAKKAVELATKRGIFWNTLGVAHYRAGEWDDAIGALRKSMQLRSGGDSFDWFFLGMAHWKLGDIDGARKWNDRAVDWMETKKPDDEQLKQFRAEAEELMKKDER